MAERLLQQLFGAQPGASPLPSQPAASEEQEDEEGQAWEAEFDLGTDDAGSGGDASAGGGTLAMDATPGDVLRRIRSATLWFVSQLCEGRLPEIDLLSREAGNRVLASDGAEADGGGQPSQGDGEGGEHQPYVLRLQQQTQRRSLLGRHPESAEQVARLWVLLGVVHGLLLAGEQATQREIWYQLKTLEIFRSPRDVAEAVQDAVALLGVPRSALGITASSKGLVAGRLVIHDQRSGVETDCSTAANGVQIPGDVARISRDWAFQSDAQLVLVVEKDAVFQRLIQQRFFDAVPCVIVTGKGVPDLATRAFLSCLSTALPELALVAACDWNPAGVNILCIYRYGGGRMGLESPHWALPTLGWLAARSDQLQQADAGAFQELTPRDRAQAGNLAGALDQAAPEWAAELRAMLASGCKAELEALDTAGRSLPDLLLQALEEGDCI